MWRGCQPEGRNHNCILGRLLQTLWRSHNQKKELRQEAHRRVQITLLMDSIRGKAVKLDMVHYGALWDITRVWGPALKVLMTLSKSGHVHAAPPLPFSPSYVPPLSLVCHSPTHQSFPHVVHSQEAARATLQMHVPTGSRTSSGSHFNLSDSWQKMERKDFWLQSEGLSYFIHVLCPLGFADR